MSFIRQMDILGEVLIKSVHLFEEKLTKVKVLNITLILRNNRLKNVLFDLAIC